MKTIWVVTVGRTDMQFLYWVCDAFGQRQCRRAEPASKGVRALHEALLVLRERGLLTYVNDPELLASEKEKGTESVGIALTTDESGFLAMSERKDVWLAPDDEAVPSRAVPKLPILFAKVATLVAHFEGRTPSDLSVVVINTRRDGAPEEPVAAGPLTSDFLAQSLDLEPGVSAGGVDWGKAGWIDVLVGDEGLETPGVPSLIGTRISLCLRSLLARTPSEEHDIVVSNLGGIPQIKSVLPRICATMVGESKVSLLVDTERGSPRPQPLDYASDWGEIEGLRFQVAESLRQHELLAAYGLASRVKTGRSWVDKAHGLLGSLCGLPMRGGPSVVATWPELEQTLARTEVALAGQDVRSAMLYLATFFEELVLFALTFHERVTRGDLTIRREFERESAVLGRSDQYCYQALADEFQPLVGDTDISLLYGRPDANAFRIRVSGARLVRWCEWLTAQPDEVFPGLDSTTRRCIENLVRAYASRRGVRQELSSLRELRNRLTHGRVSGELLREIATALADTGLVDARASEFGSRLLRAPNWQPLLRLLKANAPKSLADRLVDSIEALRLDVEDNR